MQGTADDLWIFGYGSLMWRPEFTYLERTPATVVGLHRALCIVSTHHRGQPRRPGLVLGLDQGGQCRGIAYRVAPQLARATVAYLRQRELIYGVYRETVVPATILRDGEAGEVATLTFVAERAHPNYAGRLALSEQARIIQAARGRSGSNAEYLISTVRHLQELGIRERALERLVGLAAGHAAHRACARGLRSSVTAMQRSWSAKQRPSRHVKSGDQRRFSYRLRLTGQTPT